MHLNCDFSHWRFAFTIIAVLADVNAYNHAPGPDNVLRPSNAADRAVTDADGKIYPSVNARSSASKKITPTGSLLSSNLSRSSIPPLSSHASASGYRNLTSVAASTPKPKFSLSKLTIFPSNSSSSLPTAKTSHTSLTTSSRKTASSNNQSTTKLSQTIVSASINTPSSSQSSTIIKSSETPPSSRTSRTEKQTPTSTSGTTGTTFNASNTGKITFKSSETYTGFPLLTSILSISVYSTKTIAGVTSNTHITTKYHNGINVMVPVFWKCWFCDGGAVIAWGLPTIPGIYPPPFPVPLPHFPTIAIGKKGDPTPDPSSPSSKPTSTDSKPSKETSKPSSNLSSKSSSSSSSSSPCSAVTETDRFVSCAATTTSGQSQRCTTTTSVVSGCSKSATTTTTIASASITEKPCASDTCGGLYPLGQQPLSGASMGILATTEDCKMTSIITTSVLPTFSNGVLDSIAVSIPSGDPRKRNGPSGEVDEDISNALAARALIDPNPPYTRYVELLSNLTLWVSQQGDTSGKWYNYPPSGRASVGVNGLYGCSAVIITSEKGVYLSHTWEAPVFVTSDWSETSDLDFETKAFSAIRYGAINTLSITSPIGTAEEPGVLNYAHSPEVYVITPRSKDSDRDRFGISTMLHYQDRAQRLANSIAGFCGLEALVTS
ncbi:hypothetical protein EYC80_008507 [Monilinia laxa]|uniref:Uncharacterized protein n=1 Tax=Monilinia laxa TaxID=61186 RepID=A0A5N6JQF0_MONLA|nr:hypothetical protein EYC80_008507 [Monilinia laxa]